MIKRFTRLRIIASLCKGSIKCRTFFFQIKRYKIYPIDISNFKHYLLQEENTKVFSTKNMNALWIILH